MSSRAAGATPSRASSTSATPPSHCRSTSPSSSPAIPSTGTSCRPTPPSGCGSAHPDEHAHHPRIHASYQKEETMTSLRKIAALASAGALTVGLLSACTGSSDSQSSPSGSASSKQVTITVAALLPTADDAAKQQLADRVASFEAKYPNIKVEPQDYEWLASTFTTQLAGGTLPNVFEIPLTDGKTLIENNQLADIDKYVKSLPYGGDFNEKLVANGTGGDGKIYAVPAKAIALHYNRKLFEKAGLDPDQPPTTWDEVRADAKKIHDATKVAGYAMMALD